MTSAARTTAPAEAPRVRRLSYEPGPGEAVEPVPTPPRLRIVPPPPEPPPDGPAAHRAVGETLRVALEVLDGHRVLAQLAPRCTGPALRYWRAACGRRRPVRSQARLLRMRLCRPDRAVAEVAAVCDIDGRVRALAARFEQRGGSWRCTVLRLG